MQLNQQRRAAPPRVTWITIYQHASSISGVVGICEFQVPGGQFGYEDRK